MIVTPEAPLNAVKSAVEKSATTASPPKKENSSVLVSTLRYVR